MADDPEVVSHAPYSRAWSGLVKSLIQLIKNQDSNKIRLPEVGVMELDVENKRIIIELDDIDESSEDLLIKLNNDKRS